jgi:hypothetical protein
MLTHRAILTAAIPVVAASCAGKTKKPKLI